MKKIKQFKFHKKINEENKNKNFVPLYPNDELNNEIYVDRLEEAIKDDKILNIGVMGAYGSGKSSIILGFLNRLPKKIKAMTISLATFNNENLDRNGDGKLNDNDLEIGILQQIIYKVNPKQIPLSRIVRIKENKELLFEIIISFVLYWLNSGILNDTVKYFYNILNNTLISSFINKFFPFSFILYLLYIVMFLCILLLVDTILKKFNISSLSFGGIDLTKASQDKSILNENIDEIIYILKKSKYKIIIFEDIDRFDNRQIFYKLRELNKIINDNEEIMKSGPVKFIYAVRNDILEKAEDRIKFFDYILPVIPIISSENAQLKFIEVFEKIDLKGIVSEKIIQEVSYFVSDMRMVINICNEFKVYYEKIFKKLDVQNDIDYSADKLFAIVAYKNINNKDFENIQKEDGNIQELIRLKPIIKRYEDENAKNEIEVLKSEATTKKNNKNNRIKKIKEEIIKKFCDNIRNTSSFYVDNKHYNGSIAFIDNTNIEDIFKYGIGYTSSISYTMEEIFKENTWKEEYDKIKNEWEIYSKKNEEEIYYLEEGINTNLDDILLKYMDFDELKKYLKDIEDGNVEVENAKEKECIKNLLGNKMLISFVKKGYIDESYKYYINNLYLSNLTLEEYKFINSIKRLENKDNLNVKIEHFDVVNSRLDVDDYEEIGAMNIDLLDNLLERYDNLDIEDKNKLDCLRVHAKNSILGYDYQGTKMSFFVLMMEKGKNKDMFMKLLLMKYRNIWDDIIFSNDISKENKEKYINEFLNCEIIDDMFFDYLMHRFNNQIEKMNSLKYENAIRLKRLTNNFRIENIEFDDITNFDLKTQNYVISKDMYKINKENINIILKNNLDNYEKLSKDMDYLENNLLTHLLKIENKVIQNRAKNVCEIIIELENIERISVNEFVNLLNNLTNQDKMDYVIKKFKGKVQDITTIQDEKNWRCVIQNKKAIINVNNILNYSKKYKFDDKDAEIINEFNEIIVDELNLEPYNENNLEVEAFLIKCIDLTIITNKNLLNMLKSYKGFKVNICEFEDIEVERVEFLVDNNYIEFTIKNYEYLVDMQIEQSKLAEFCINSIDLFIENIDKLIFENGLLEKIIFSDIDEEIKYDLLERLEYNVECNDSNEANYILSLICKDKEKYMKYFDFENIKILFNISDSDDIKMTFIRDYLNVLSKENVHKLLELFNTEIYRNISEEVVTDKDIEIPLNDKIVNILNLLSRKGYIKISTYPKYNKVFVRKNSM